MLFKKKKSFALNAAVILSVLGGMFGIVPVVQASTLTVINSNDSGSGSLRQAIADAVSGDTITFDSSLAGQTITLASTLVISKDLTIDGSALLSQVSVSGNNTVRVFTIGSGVTVTIDSLIIKNGFTNTYGGGIYNRGFLTIANSTFLENSAYPSGNGLGGGVLSLFGTLSIRDSVFVGNTAMEGGGLNNNNSNTANLVNVTFVGNSAHIGGGINNHGLLNLTNTTISDNTGFSGFGGVFNAGTMNYENSIIANSIGYDCYNADSFGTINININNLVETYMESPNDCGVPVVTGDPQLDTLADNGGSTQTMALGANSPAIDAGDDATCEFTDQRGVTRPQGSHCDIGAYEKTIYYVKWNASGANNGTSWTDAYTDLQSALSAAMSSDEVWVAAGTYKPTTSTDRAATFGLKNGVAIYGGFAGTETMLTERNPSSNVTILSGDLNGNDNSNIAHDEPTRAENVLHVVSSSDIGSSTVLDGFTISGGNANVNYNEITSRGGGMLNFNGNPTLNNLIFNGNSSVMVGGGVSNENNSNPAMTNIDFINNSSEGGGGLSNHFSSPTLTNILFDNNSATYSGGGVANFNTSSPIFVDVTFTENTSYGFGGGMSNYSSTPNISRSTFYNNHVFGDEDTGQGGGMYNSSSNATVENATFSGNTAVNGGSGVANLNSNPTFLNVTFTGNWDAIRNISSHPAIGNSIIWGNVYPPTGGIFTISNDSGSTSLVRDSVIQNGYAGGINIITTDPLLGPLDYYGGNTQTVSLSPGSSAIDQGDQSYCATTDQRNVARPQGNGCDIGAFEYIEDTTAPNVISIVRADPNPTNGDELDFIVTFSESVSGVDVSDFELTTTGGLSGTSITGVNGLDETYTVTVNTGSGDGTIRLDVLDDNTIINTIGNSLNGGFISGEEYTIITSEPFADVDVIVAGNNQTNYSIAPQYGIKASYSGVNNGPVKVTSTNGVPILASERVAYSPDGGSTWTSHAELMGLPANLVHTSYTFPFYNNVDLNSQLRFGNVGNATTTVTVIIGGQPKGSYTLAPNASRRVSYTGLNAGPVVIQSNGQPIIASLRVAYNDGTAWTSFSEMMGLPSNKLTSSYVFPFYNNLDLNSQLRFGNVGTSTTTVTVTIGGQLKGTYQLAPNASQRISYAGLNAGPVKVTSSGNVPIIASVRVAYTPDGGLTWPDFTEMMGLPSASLGSQYSFPAYDNVHHNSQLRFGNVGTVGTTVTVTINGILKGTYNLAPNASQRVSYSGLDSGPVVIQSSGNVPIIASLRVAYTPDGGVTWTSFAEMMGLPQSQLTTSYYFPWYNNIDLDTQLRIGVP